MAGENIADEIKSRCNIADVVGRQISLKKTGSNHTGLCPFHNEKTPSFVVSESRQRFTCYGCGASGDVIEFVKRYYNLSFLEAAEMLAKEYGIDWKSKSFNRDEKREKFYEINKAAALFFYAAFKRGGSPANDYMNERGVSAATLKKFGVGYADAMWESLYRGLSEKGISEDLMLELGLVTKSGNGCYDRYRDRVMFPIINTGDKVIGFGGRVIGDGEPKYLNSSESRIFSKKNNLYGLNLTRREIMKKNQVILVEGYMDVIALYDRGVWNVTASLGTALTAAQAAMLRRYTENVVLCYDADEAGRNAAFRAMDLLREAGCAVKVLRMTGAKDPDEYIKKNGGEAFLDLVRKAAPFVEYKLETAKEAADLSETEGSVAFLKEAAKILRNVSPVEADIYIKKTAKETGVSEGAIRMEIYGENGVGSLNPYIPSLRTAERSAGRASRAEAASDGALRLAPESSRMIEKYFIRLLLLKRSYLPKIAPYARVFRTPALYRIYESAAALYGEEDEIDIRKLADGLEAEEQRLLEDILRNVQLADKEDEVFRECVAHVETAELVVREGEIISVLSVADEDEDSGKVERLTRELLEIQQAKNELKGR
ncbi:MAG: DNA primase [Clostridiales Family XIII bacterium]|nr:DNA primase [Clostridiales Family XIII bacterium]